MFLILSRARLSLKIALLCFYFTTILSNNPNLVTTHGNEYLLSHKIDSKEPEQLPHVKGANDNWWQQVQKKMNDQEYFITWDEKQKVFQSPNRNNNFRSTYKGDELRLMPRNDESTWNISFKLLHIESGEQSTYFPLKDASATAKNNKIAFDHKNFTVEYENTMEGVRENVIVKKPLKGNGHVLRVALRVNDEVLVNKVSDDELQLVRQSDQKTEKLLTYSGLKAWDATGRKLSGFFETNDHEISWVVNIENAIYPVTIDPLSQAPDWTGEANQAGARYGFSVASAGDVNGDGYDDVIVGADMFDNGQTNEGKVFVYYGSASGLNTTPAWSAESDQANAGFGISVASAGDVNNDGYSDVIVGARFYDNGETDEGRAFVYYGSASGLSATANWTAEGDQVNAVFGISVASAGDVNHDGFSDVIVGVDNYDNGETDEGRAYVYYGSASGLSITADWTGEVNNAGAHFGHWVAPAGDVNGDGFDDVIIGAFLYNGGQGGAFVYHGSAGGLSSTPDWSKLGEVANATLDIVATAGDVNNDGYSDVMIGARNFTGSLVEEGKVYVYHGSATGLSNMANWTVQSNQANARLGIGLGPAGDVNGDGYDDIIVGANQYDNGETDEGRAWVYFGSSAGLSNAANWIAESNQANAFFGSRVSCAGDVNGDGFDDIIIGAFGFDDGETDEGAAFAYYGSPWGLSASRPVVTSFTPASGPVGTTVTISGINFNASPANNIVYFGAVRAAVTGGSTTSLTVTVPAGATYQPISVLDNTTGLTGYSSRPFITTFTNPFGTGIPANYYQPKVDFTTNQNPFSVAIGDLDGDGKPEMVVANQLSASVSVFRNTSTLGSISASSFADKVDFAVGSIPLFVAIGDVDGDGKPDLVTANAGANTVSVLRNTSTGGSITSSSFADKIDFFVGAFPYSVAIGDMDGDGKPELMTSNYNADNISVLRNTSVPGSISASSFADKVDFSAGTNPQYVATSDLDGDGKPDLVVANSGSGTVSVLRNTSTFGSISASSFATKVDFSVGNSSNPSTVVIGDMDGDGKPDVAVADYNAASISVFRNISTPGTINSSSFATKIDFTAGSAPYSVALGDVDGDGKPDIVIGNNNPVTVSVLRNTSTTGVINASSFAGKVDFATSNGTLSIAVGDLDGDGIPELVTANFGSGTLSILKINGPPEINVKGNSVTIVDGDLTPTASDHTDFGGVSTGGNIVRTFTIQNTGTGNLTVSSISITGPDASLFTAGTLTPASPIGPAGSATFTVTFAPTTNGLKTATVNIANDDGDEALYDFAIQGTGTSSANVNLANLVISQGILTPSFASGTTSYTASVANNVTSLTVTPTLEDATASVTVNGVPVADGTPSGAISLSVGSNIITTVVTAQDATTTKTYTIDVTRAAPSVTFSGRVFLQGPYNTGTGTMNNLLNTSGILQANASTQPYNVTGFNYAGTENVAGGFFAAHPEIVDWVIVELRDASTITTIVARRAAFLKQDGNLLETDGLSNQINFAGVSPGNYNVAIRHRNHLSVLSSAAIDFNSGTGSYDFTTAVTKAYAGSVSNPPMATLATGVYGMYAGNANVDLTVRKTGSASVNDYSLFLNAVSSTAAPGPTGVYRNEDINMDGNIRKTGSASTNDYSKLLSILGALNIITQPAF